jgi:tetratricopeptide (TPR) repeat protein
MIFASWTFLVSAQNTNPLSQQTPAQPTGTNSATVVPIPTYDANSFVIQRMQDQLDEVRRDELNYRVEKEILEKTYSSNTQTVSTIVTILFGVFAILGFFGLKDLTSLKKEFVMELQRQQDARRNFETVSKELLKKQEIVESDYKKLYQQNIEQGKKVQVLQMREKIASIMSTGNFYWALENIAVALSLDPKNAGLLSQKAECLSQLGDFSNALLCYKEALSIDPRDEASLQNCMELMLLQKDFDGFSNLASSNAALIKSKHGGALAAYFRILELYQKGEQAELKIEVEKLIKSAPEQKSQMIPRWRFAELKTYLKGQPESLQKGYVLTAVDLLEGAINRDEAGQKLSLQ